jgi:hypothetical protein
MYASSPTVIPQTAPSVYDLTAVAQVNAELGLTSGTANDATVASQITSCSKIIAAMCDRVFALETVSQTFRIRLDEAPVEVVRLARFPTVSVSSITVGGLLLSSDHYELDAEYGMLYRRFNTYAWYRSITQGWHGDIVVVYTGGYDLPAEAPASLARACIELIKSYRMNSTRDMSIRDIAHGDTRVSYTQGAAVDGAPPVVTSLIQSFKRLAV